METIRLHNLHNAEHLALMKELHKLMVEAELEPLNGLKTQFATWVTKAEDAQKQIIKSEHTENIAHLDLKRDNLYRGLALRVQSESYHPNTDRHNGARKVQIVLDTYGNIITSNYEKQTIEMQNLIADLKSADYTDAVTAIGLGEWVTALESANNEFHTLYTVRRDEYAGKESFNLKEIRKELDDLYKQLREMTAALKILQPSDKLNILISKANVNIVRWKDILAQRKGGREHLEME